MRLDAHGGSNQGVLSHIVGNQEYARELARQRYLSRHWFQRIKLRNHRFFFGTSSYQRNRDAILERRSGKEIVVSPVDASITDLEFGVGLDTTSAFSHVTVLAQRDADWVVPDEPEMPSRYWHMMSTDVRDPTRSLDLVYGEKPFNGIAPTSTGTVPIREGTQRRAANHRIDLPPRPDASASWSQVPLYTHLWTGDVPASVHLNAADGGTKVLRETSWGQMWWSGYARDMLQTHVDGEEGPIATVRGREWWSAVSRKGGPMLDNGSWVDWRTLYRNKRILRDLFWVQDGYEKRADIEEEEERSRSRSGIKHDD
ncbi:MAG: hypothetical protein M1828_000452 [Chrysothrix sp. TS-e1954]|nr:MAG: hypothetical protein M1828_000452 [Chrysothrix sp. TS-e1954]